LGYADHTSKLIIAVACKDKFIRLYDLKLDSEKIEYTCSIERVSNIKCNNI